MAGERRRPLFSPRLGGEWRKKTGKDLNITIKNHGSKTVKILITLLMK
jgi:hypothetical protein